MQGNSNDSSSHIVLGGEETDRTVQDVRNAFSFDLNEDTAQQSIDFGFDVVDAPYPNESPHNILGRWNQIYSGTFSGGTDISIQVLASLLNLPVIKKALSGFEYFRAGVEAKVVVSTTVFNYGAMFVTNASLLDYNFNGYGSWKGEVGFVYERLLSNNPLLFDLSQQNEGTIDFPWPFPFQWLPLREWYNSDPLTTDSVSVHSKLSMFSPLVVGRLDTTNPSSIAVNVYARMKDVFTQGLCEDSTFVPPDEIDGQSLFNTVVNTGLATASVAMGGLASDVIKGEIKGYMQQGIEVAKDKVGQKFGKDEKADNCEPDRSDPVSEAASVYPDMWGELVNNSSPVRTVLPYNQGLPPWHKIIDYLTEPSYIFSSSWALTTAFSVETWPIRNDASTGRIRYVSQFFRFWRGSVTYTFVILASPLVSAKIRWHLRWNLVELDTLTDNIQGQLVTVRGTTIFSVTIPYLSQTPWNVCSETDEETYLCNTDPTISMYPRLILSPVQGLVALGDVTTAVHIYCYQSAGPDFQFFSLRQANIKYPLALDDEIEGQMHISDIVRDSLGAQGSTPTKPKLRREGAIYLEEIGRRYGNYVQDTVHFSAPFPELDGTNTTLEGWPNVTCLAGIFFYYRGSFDWKLAMPSDIDAKTAFVFADNGCPTVGVPDSFPLDPETSVTMGQARVDPTFTSILDVKTPVQGILDWWPVALDAAGFPRGQVVGSYCYSVFGFVQYFAGSENGPIDPLAEMVRAGQDIGFAYILPPPASPSLWPKVTFEEGNKKNNGTKNKFNFPEFVRRNRTSSRREYDTTSPEAAKVRSFGNQPRGLSSKFTILEL